MSDKVVDLDPSKRLSKEAFKMLKESLDTLKYEDLQSITVITTPKNGITSVQAYGMDFYALGVAQSVLTTLGQELLVHDFISEQ
jgi:uncharacterized membrane protein YgcG